MADKHKYEQLLKIAKNRGYNITEVAKKIGLSHTTLKNGIENEIIQLKYLKKIINLLDIDPLFFFDKEYKWSFDNKRSNIASEKNIPYGQKGLFEEMAQQLKFMRKLLENYQQGDSHKK